MDKVTKFARFLRSNMTDAEILLWSRLRHDQLGHRFRRQHKIENYIIDFYCAELKLAIEVDGGQHDESKADKTRTKTLNDMGIRVLRFWNSDIMNNIEGVLTQISLSLNPSPSLHEEEGDNANPWRKDFPALQQTMHGKPVAFLDSGASAQKPQSVLDAITQAYTDGYANIHRGLYDFSQRKTAEFENAREKIAGFIGSLSAANIIFTRNATEGINLVAQAWGRTNLKAGDEIILTVMEHHANLVPWHILRDQIGIVIKYIPVTDRGELDLDCLPSLLSTKTKMVACTQVSNVLGTVNNISKIKTILSVFNPEIKLLVDGSQAVVHTSVNMTGIDADFYVFTGHKLYGPTGVGVLYGKTEMLESMPPYQGGGDMIETVTLDGSTYAAPPSRFEAGTPAIAEIIGLGAAVDYVTSIGMDKIAAWERELLSYTNAQLERIDGLDIIGTAEGKAGIVSFTMRGCPPADVAMILDQCGVAVRTGHHCCQPLMQRFGVDGTIRASLGLYNTKNDIDQLIDGLCKAQRMLS